MHLIFWFGFITGLKFGCCSSYWYRFSSSIWQNFSPNYFLNFKQVGHCIQQIPYSRLIWRVLYLKLNRSCHLSSLSCRIIGLVFHHGSDITYPSYVIFLSPYFTVVYWSSSSLKGRYLLLCHNFSATEMEITVPGKYSIWSQTEISRFHTYLFF